MRPQCFPDALHRVRQRTKVEVLHLDRRKDNSSTSLGSGEPNRWSDRLEIVQHEDRRIVETEILDRLGDLSILDQERTVASETRVELRDGSGMALNFVSQSSSVFEPSGVNPLMVSRSANGVAAIATLAMRIDTAIERILTESLCDCR